MTQGAQRPLPYPDISPLDGEIHLFPTLGTFLWYLATRVFYTTTEYPTKYCVVEILSNIPVSYTHLRAHETREDLVCRLLLEKKKK